MIKKILILSVLVIFLFFNVIAVDDYVLSEPLIKVLVEKGGSISDTVSILGTGGESFKIEYSSMENFLSVSPIELVLDSSGVGSFKVNLDSGDLSEGVYVGKIVVEGDHIDILPVVFEVVTFGFSPLFDVTVEISSSDKGINIGEILEYEVIVHHLKGPGDRAILNYKITDLNGNVFLSETQNLDVPRKVGFRKSFDTTDLELGDYVLSITANDAAYLSTGTTAGFFSVVPVYSFSPEDQSGEQFDFYLYMSFLIILVLAVSFFVFNHYWNKKVAFEAKHWNTKLTEIKRTKFSSVAKEIRKLEHQKNILEKAHDKGYIKKASYETGRIKVNSLIETLKKRL